MAAALLYDEKAGNLALHVRCYYDSARLRQRLDSRRSVRCITVNLTCRIDDYRPGFRPTRAFSAGLPVPALFRFTSASARWIASAARARAQHRSHGRPDTEERHQAIAKLLRDMAAHLRHRR